jgi:hypothetical protein
MVLEPAAKTLEILPPLGQNQKLSRTLHSKKKIEKIPMDYREGRWLSE